MRPLHVVGVVVASHLAWAGERNPAVVVLPQAEDVKDVSGRASATTTYLVRDPYPGDGVATQIQQAMSAAGWTLLHEAPNVTPGDVLSILSRIPPEVLVDGVAWSDRRTQHYATQFWTDAQGNSVLYAMSRRCGHEADGLHSVYVTVRATYRRGAQRKEYGDAGQMLAEALAETGKQQELGDRVSPTPTPSAKPTPCPSP